MKNATQQTTARQLWNAEFRAFRMAQKLPIMAENTIAIRLGATTRMRNLTGKWDLPIALPRVNQSHRAFNKGIYNPSLAFRRFLKAC